MCVTRISLSVWCPFAPFCFRVSRSLSFYVTRDILQFGEEISSGTRSTDTEAVTQRRKKEAKRTKVLWMDLSSRQFSFLSILSLFSSPFCPFSSHYSSLWSFEKNGDERSYDTICLWQQLMTGKERAYRGGKWWEEERRVTTAQHAIPSNLSRLSPFETSHYSWDRREISSTHHDDYHPLRDSQCRQSRAFSDYEHEKRNVRTSTLWQLFSLKVIKKRTDMRSQWDSSLGYDLFVLNPLCVFSLCVCKGEMRARK